MALPRELLAATLGIALGLVFVAFPTFVFKVHTLGRGRHDPHGGWGSDDVETKWLRVVQAVGVLAILFGAYFGYSALLA